MNKLAIVGIFFDGYYDIWEDFLELFEKNWPNCPYPLYIVNNKKELCFSKEYKVTVLHAGEGAEYSRKVQLAVNNIEAEHYLLLLEDFFIGEKLKENVLESIMDKIYNENIKYYRMPLTEFISSKEKDIISEMTPNMEYTVSCQPSIWKRDFLQQCIGTDNYNAWIFEGIYAKARIPHTEQFLKGCVNDTSNVLCLYHGALQGKMLNSTYTHFKNVGYSFKNKREILSLENERKHTKKQKIKSMCPIFIQRFIKKHMRTNSVVERYKDDIERLIIKMNLD